MLQIQHLNFRYKGNHSNCLNDLSLTLEKGEALGLLGHNGAGKTTLLNIISGLLPAPENTVIFEAHQNNNSRISQLSSLIPQEFAFYNDLTVIANLKIFISFLTYESKRKQSILSDVIAKCKLDGLLNTQAKKLSGGQKRRLNLAIGLLKDAPLLLLDEPTVGIDPEARRTIIDIINKLSDDGKTIIYTSHLLDDIEKTCSKIAILHNGEWQLKPTGLNEINNSNQLSITFESAPKVWINKYNHKKMTDNHYIIFNIDQTHAHEILNLCKEQSIDIIEFNYGKQALESFYLKLVETL